MKSTRLRAGVPHCRGDLPLAGQDHHGQVPPPLEFTEQIEAVDARQADITMIIGRGRDGR